ncbi:hypothetical protein VTN00DRAFT_5590 [Thermoascus crustaceus]|uniref:uncharacterized protein n=1 Tax=Thermoascus crustaceus TaxID=5088 RepID=UPI0037424892
MATSSNTSSPSYSFSKPPIFLLKTRSTPHDGYEEYFSAHGYVPAFVPVLEHRFNEENLRAVRDLFLSGELNESAGRRRKYGGLIFTSQRAVEGFTRVVRDEVGVETASSASHSLILYTVGPATARSLSAIRDTHLPHAEIFGADAGNGENLARMILEHYNGIYNRNTSEKPPLLFLVGEQRRDIIPKTLMSESPSAQERIQVDELVVYETGVMASFEGDFRAAVAAGKTYLDSHNNQSGDGDDVMWTAVFSPTGCDAMLRVLNSQLSGSRSGSGEQEEEKDKKKRWFIATIGPTTRDHLRSKYGVEADVCAEKPSPEGVGEGIKAFMDRRRKDIVG